MIEEKIVYIIPGFRHKPKNKAYKEIARILKSEEYLPILITIPWRKTTISENAEYFLKEYKKIRAKKKYILGFSYGAMIAFLAATKVHVTGLILCSLSPYFKEDLVKGKKSFASFTKGFRYQGFSKLESTKLAKQIKTKQILMLYGEKETKSLVTRVNETFDNVSSRKKFLITVEQTGHEIGSKRYLHTIHQVARALH